MTQRSQGPWSAPLTFSWPFSRGHTLFGAALALFCVTAEGKEERSRKAFILRILFWNREGIRKKAFLEPLNTPK